jgi:hypothetical protein
MKRFNFVSFALATVLAFAAATFYTPVDAAVTNYQIVSGKNPSALQTAVVAAIGNGYQPVGAAFVGQSGQYSQTMVLGTPTVTNSYPSTEVYNPTVANGNTVTITPDAYLYNTALHMAGTIAGATVNITAGTNNGQQVRVTCDAIITTLTAGANLAGDFIALPSACAVGSSFIFVWSVAKSKWEYMGNAI